MALTERQKEIQDLLKQGKKASEIAEALGITTNAVYQQIRRSKGGGKSGGATKAAAKSGPKSTKAAPKAATPAAASTPAPKAATPARQMTPLQSIRARRDELTADIKAAEGDRDAAQKVLEKAEQDLAKVKARHEVELAGLLAAEAALKGELSLPTPAEAEPVVAEAPTAPEEAPQAPVTPEEPVTGTAPAPEAPKARSARSNRRKATDEPTTQAEREESAEFEPEVAAQEAATAPDAEPVAA